MPNFHAHSLPHNENLIDKKVIVYTKDKMTIGILCKVDQVVYGVKSTYTVIVDEQQVRVQGILIPYSLTIEHDIKVSPELATENFIFAPFRLEDF